MFNWFRRKPEGLSFVEEADRVAQEALDRVCEGIDLVNANMPLLVGQRLSLYIDRDYKPARVVLTDWAQTHPTVIHGEP